MVTAVAGGLGRALDVLDGARRAVLRRLGRVSAIAALRRRRELRLTTVALSSVALAFVLALVVTLPLLALSPLLLGVPHVASDVRYLLVRPLCGSGLPARAWRPVSALFVLAVGLGVAGEARLALLAAGGAVLVAGLSTDAPVRARALFALLCGGVLAVATLWPRAAALVLAQGHNLVAIALAGWLVRARLRAGWLVALALAAGIAAIALGLCDGLLAGAGLGAGFGATWRDALATVVPDGVGPVVARRWVAIFAFAQSVHYGAWLRWLPDAARTGARPPSFRRSYQLLEQELGRPATLGVIGLSLALPLAACVSLDGARHAYLGLALFHGFIELAFVACLVLTRGAARRGPA